MNRTVAKTTWLETFIGATIITVVFGALCFLFTDDWLRFPTPMLLTAIFYLSAYITRHWKIIMAGERS